MGRSIAPEKLACFTSQPASWRTIFSWYSVDTQSSFHTTLFLMNWLYQQISFITLIDFLRTPSHSFLFQLMGFYPAENNPGSWSYRQSFASAPFGWQTSQHRNVGESVCLFDGRLVSWPTAILCQTASQMKGNSRWGNPESMQCETCWVQGDI